MATINILYISFEGNTRSFVTRLAAYATQQHSINSDNPAIQVKEITADTPQEAEKEPFFCFVPTYLDGGNGIDSGYTEIMTNPMGEYIAANGNAKKCIGVVGSGNRNFNKQYCLTAKKYAREFNAPFVADYELRGTSKDIEKIYRILSETFKKSTQE